MSSLQENRIFDLGILAERAAVVADGLRLIHATCHEVVPLEMTARIAQDMARAIELNHALLALWRAARAEGGA